MSLLVSVSNAILVDPTDLLRKLRKVGMKVDRLHQDAGVLTGTIDETKVSDLMRIDGIEAVEEDRSVEIAPPDSDVQ